VLGRLSMWRAYGVGTGIAIVMNPAVFQSASDALQAFSIPVIYANADEVQNEFQAIVSGVVSAEARLAKLPAEQVLGIVWNMLEYCSLGLKHPAFTEELEWRVVHCPTLRPTDRVKSSVEVIRGFPQTVYKVPLEDIPEEGFEGASIPSLIDSVII